MSGTVRSRHRAVKGSRWPIDGEPLPLLLFLPIMQAFHQLLPLLGALLACRSVWGQQFEPVSSTPFNVDLQFPVHVSASAVIQSRNKNSTHSLFASSVLVTSEGDSSRHNLFVGAPALVSRFNSSLVPGGLFHCPLDLDRTSVVSCSEIVLNSEISINSLGFSGNYVPRNRSLVGFNLYSFFKDKVITCAPNWAPPTKMPTPEGLCLELDSQGNALRGFKMNIQSKNHLRQSRPFESHALFGFSLAFDENQGQILAGIPGFDDFTGSVSVVNSDFQARRLDYQTSGRLRRSRLNTYTGYAVDFVTFGRNRYILLGSPRYEKFNGKVDLIDAQREQMLSPLMGPSSNKGEFFGASLLVLDHIGSKQKDLLVGAPFFSLRNRRELGRVYLYRDLQLYLRGQRTPPEVITARSAPIGAHFGAAMSAIDLNRDGFKDLIISAPFESTSRDYSGAIYIYYGTSRGLDTDPDHVIKIDAQSVSKTPLRGFGYSLWTASDVDQNEYSDVVAGSVLSEQVTILRSIPIIQLSLSMHFDRKGINLTDTRGCNGENACFRVNFCLSTGTNLPFPRDLSYLIEFVVTDHKLHRVVVDRLSTVIPSRQNSVCGQKEHAFFVQVKKKEDLYDITTPIEMTMTATLQRPPTKQFCSWCPVANPVNITGEIGFEHGCAKKVCVSRLNLKSTFRYGGEVIGDSIVQGRFDHFEIEVEVHNQGESSIDTLLFISITPPSLTMRAKSLAERRCRLSVNNSSSFSPSSSVGGVYECDVSKVLAKGKNERFKLQFDLENIKVQSLSFDLRLNSTSETASQSRLEATKRFAVTKEASLRLSSTNQHYNGTTFSDHTPTVLILTSFLVDKSGPSSVNGSYLQFYLPDDIIEVAKPPVYKCKQVKQVDTVITNSLLINGTLSMPCYSNPELCTKYECALGAFDSDLKSLNYALDLQFIPSRIKLNYERLFFQLRLELYADDVFLKRTAYDAIDIDITFERQATRLTKSSPLIMIGGGGIGLLILLITVIVLIKNGFFKRKKRDQLLQAKQRMSMNPNLFPNNITGLERDENDD